MVRQEVHDGPQGHGGRQRQRIPVDSRGYGAEVQGADAVGLRQKQAAAVAGGQQGRLPLLPALPDGTWRVDHIPGPQAVARRQLGPPPLAAPQRPALRQQLRPRRRVDGPVHPGAAQQRGIGRVDNGLRVRTGDISHQNGKAIHSRPPVPLCRPDTSRLLTVYLPPEKKQARIRACPAWLPAV